MKITGELSCITSCYMLFEMIYCLMEPIGDDINTHEEKYATHKDANANDKVSYKLNYNLSLTKELIGLIVRLILLNFWFHVMSYKYNNKFDDLKKRNHSYADYHILIN